MQKKDFFKNKKQIALVVLVIFAIRGFSANSQTSEQLNAYREEISNLEAKVVDLEGRLSEAENSKGEAEDALAEVENEFIQFKLDNDAAIQAGKEILEVRKQEEEQREAEASVTQEASGSVSSLETTAPSSVLTSPQVENSTPPQAQQQFVVPPVSPVISETQVPPVQQVSYANCTEVRNAGAAPIYAGQPGFGSHLDRDGDGIACE